jgi:integrase/YHS domain-containing protein
VGSNPITRLAFLPSDSLIKRYLTAGQSAVFHQTLSGSLPLNCFRKAVRSMAKTPSYRHHKGSGQACTKIRGKTYYFGAYGTPESKRRFRELLAQYLLSENPTTFGVEVAELTLAEVCLSYANHAKSYYGSHRPEYKNILLALRPISELMPRKLAKEFGPLDFKQIRQWWLNRDASRQYANKQMSRVVRAVKWLVSEGILPPAIHQAIKCVSPLTKGHCKAREAPPVTPVSEQVVNATLPHLSRVVADMVRFQRFTGCRPGEVCSITPAIVDRSNAVWEIRLDHHKTAWRGKKRTIYVGPEAQAILLPYLSRKSDAFCFDPREAMQQKRSARNAARTTPLSCGNRPGTNRVSKPSRIPGDRYCTTSYGRAIIYACRKAFPAPKGLKGDALKAWHAKHQWSPNQLRHTFATKIRKSHGLEAASVLLGHSGLVITETYAEQDQAKAIEVISRVG